MIIRKKKVLVIGLGKSGLAALRFLHQKGAHVFVTDRRSRREVQSYINKVPKSVRLELGSHRFFKQSYDLIVVSPGVPWDIPFLVKMRQKKVPVWSELELGWRFIQPKQTIAVTGTNGKTTTTALLGHILKKGKISSQVCGNIGTPLVQMIPKIKRNTTLVLEVSSYQLEGHVSFSPDVGIILNLTPDHLVRHKTMRRYARIKSRLLVESRRDATAVLNRADPWVRKMGAWIKTKKSWFPSPQLMKMGKNIALPGTHNLENAMAASAACLALGISKQKIIAGLKSFQGVPHRFQNVRQYKGRTFINDSKATNVDSTRVALQSSAAPTYLIMGGQHKGASYKPLIPLLRRKVKGVLTIGEAHKQIQRDLNNVVPLYSCGVMSKAIKTAHSLAKPGSHILLSPACASFDQYRNFEKRGDHFIRIVKGLRS